MYTSKYLPVDGISVGDTFKADHNDIYGVVTNITRGKENGLIIHYGENLFTVDSLGSSYKLFLISDDIQVGDKAFSTQYKPETERLVIPKGQWMNPIYEGIPTMEEGAEGYKVIGEIITPDIKEGETFTEDQFEVDYVMDTLATETGIHVKII